MSTRNTVDVSICRFSSDEEWTGNISWVYCLNVFPWLEPRHASDTEDYESVNFSTQNDTGYRSSTCNLGTEIN